MARPKVVIVGGGFGGITAARNLALTPVEVTVVDRNNYHTFQPLLYQVATAGLDTGDVAHSLRAGFRREKNVEFRLGTVVGADVGEKVVHLADGTDLDYDYLVLGTGAETNYFGVKGAQEHSLPMKTLDHAVAIRNHVLRAFEACANDPERIAEGWLNIVIVGGGPTGVELAGGMAELLKVLRHDYHHLVTNVAQIYLLDGGHALLAPYTEKSRKYCQRVLERAGVEVRLNTRVTEVRADAVVLGDHELATRTVIWAGGVKAQAVADNTGLTQTHGGRVEVQRDCSVKGHPEVFVIGDTGATPDKAGDPYPQLAQPAIQQGRHVAHQIGRRLKGEPPTDFHYLDKGTMATIGRGKAVVELPNKWRFQGRIAFLMWLGLHLLYLAGFRNRANVLVNWGWSYVTYDRGARLITDHPSQE
jgi:NADH:quinone reductase (non-electrogenic)